MLPVLLLLLLQLWDENGNDYEEDGEKARIFACFVFLTILLLAHCALKGVLIDHNLSCNHATKTVRLPLFSHNLEIMAADISGLWLAH